ncbi:MAG: hypothetical protein V1858_05220 [Candidatus Gottesmanbacteria bacterium]
MATQEQFCSNCGNKKLDSGDFCNQCGFKIVEEIKNNETLPIIKKRRWPWVLVSIIIIALGTGAFYWFQLRPSSIRAACQIEADNEYQMLFDANYQHQADGRIISKNNTWHVFSIEDHKGLRDSAQEVYQPCLRRYGL